MKTVFQADGRRFIVLPYNGFAHFGWLPPDATPRVAVPFYDAIEDALAEPYARARDYESALERMNVSRPGQALQAMAGVPSVARGPNAPKLSLGAKFTFPFLLFRGESREEHGILPSLYRRLDDERQLCRRLAKERRAAKMMTFAAGLAGRRLTQAQARAAARHYGAPSTFVDFSYDPGVAGYFGHPPFRVGEREEARAAKPPIGILYSLGFERLAQVFPLQGWAPSGTGEFVLTFYAAGRTVHLAYDAADAANGARQPRQLALTIPGGMENRVKLRGILVPGIKRIAAQYGMFLEIEAVHFDDWPLCMMLWYMLDFLCEKWCYLRRDEQFQDPGAGLTAAGLLPRDALPIRVAGRFAS